MRLLLFMAIRFLIYFSDTYTPRLCLTDIFVYSHYSMLEKPLIVIFFLCNVWSSWKCMKISVFVVFPKAVLSALYSSCILPLSVLWSLDLYADDNQLVFSVHPLNFDSSISHVQNALQQLSSRVTANLTLNSSKTEFLLIGLKQPNLPKYTMPHNGLGLSLVMKCVLANVSSKISRLHRVKISWRGVVLPFVCYPRMWCLQVSLPAN